MNKHLVDGVVNALIEFANEQVSGDISHVSPLELHQLYGGPAALLIGKVMAEHEKEVVERMFAIRRPIAYRGQGFRFYETWGSGNTIELLPGKELDLLRPVQAYLALNGSENTYSIRQGGENVAWCTRLMLGSALFVDNGADGSQHYVEGKVALMGGMGTDATLSERKGCALPALIEYTKHGWQCTNLTTKPSSVKGADVVTLNQQGIRASYTH